MKTVVHVARATLVAVVVLGVALASWSWAQSKSTAGFASLPPGEQKIVRALFEAQKSGTAKPLTKPLTLDEIAARKSSGGGGWGEVFKSMKAQGLVTGKNLGEVVSAYERKHPEVASKAGKPDKAAKPDKLEKVEKPERMEKPEKPEKVEKPGR